MIFIYSMPVPCLCRRSTSLFHFPSCRSIYYACLSLVPRIIFQVLRLGAASSSPDHSDEPKPLDDHRCDQLQAPPRSRYRATRVTFFHFDKTSVSHHRAPLSNPDFSYRPWRSNHGTCRPRPPPAFGHTSTHTHVTNPSQIEPTKF